MYKSLPRLITAVVVAIAGVYFGLRLAVYAEKDDAPGGVVIGVALMFGAVALGLWLALRQARKPDSPAGG